MEDVPIAEARANLTEIAAQVRLLRKTVMLTRRGTPQAVMVPVDMGELIEAAGGPDMAAVMLRQLIKKGPTAVDAIIKSAERLQKES